MLMSGGNQIYAIEMYSYDSWSRDNIGQRLIPRNSDSHEYIIMRIIDNETITGIETHIGWDIITTVV